jgi:GNAT superfamily N-acetyltransferase
MVGRDQDSRFHARVNEMLRLATLIGRDMTPLLPDLARLCTVVFRDWPHLYEGDGRYDTEHLEALAASPRSALIIAYDGGMPVGASTCLPLEGAMANYQAPFLARGWPLERFFYLAESVLLPAYRGQGIGEAFFARREAHIRAASTCDFACFCTIQRPEDHPLRPPATTSLDAFWRRRGYVPVPGLHCTMRWKEIGQAGASDMTMQFWSKSLTGAVLRREGEP